MERNCQKVWEECLGFIKDNLVGSENEKVFTTWFEPIRPIGLDGTTLTIQVPSQFFYEWLEQNYAGLLKNAIGLTLGPQARLQYSIIMDTSISDSPITTNIPSTGRQNTTNRPKDFGMNLNNDGFSEFPNPFVIPGIQRIHDIAIPVQCQKSF